MPIDDLLPLMQQFVSGEAMALDDAKTLEGALLRHVGLAQYDCAGLATTVSADFKGNLLHTTRRRASASKSREIRC